MPGVYIAQRMDKQKVAVQQQSTNSEFDEGNSFIYMNRLTMSLPMIKMIIGYTKQGLPFQLIVKCYDEMFFKFVNDALLPIIDTYEGHLKKSRTQENRVDITQKLINNIFRQKFMMLNQINFELALAVTYPVINGYYCSGFSMGSGEIGFVLKEKSIHFFKYHGTTIQTYIFNEVLAFGSEILGYYVTSNMLCLDLNDKPLKFLEMAPSNLLQIINWHKEYYPNEDCAFTYSCIPDLVLQERIVGNFETKTNNPTEEKIHTPKSNLNKFLWLLVAGGVVIAGATLCFLSVTTIIGTLGGGSLLAAACAASGALLVGIGLGIFCFKTGILTSQSTILPGHMPMAWV